MLRSASPLNATTGSVVRLTPSLVEKHLESAPLLFLVNICWKACGFCQALEADWQRLAKRMRHEVVVASWDVGRRPDVPEQLGHANTTPTIRAIVPAATAGGKRRFVNYVGTRTLKDMVAFAVKLMPDFVVRVDSDEAWEELRAHATSEQQPRLLCFLGLPADAPTPPLLKALSATYKDLLVAEIRVHESAPSGAAIAARFGVSALPSFVALRAEGEHDPWRHMGAPTFRRLSWFAESTLNNPKRLGEPRKDEL